MRNRIRQARLARGLDQQELARVAGVSRQTIGSIESGRSDPSTAVALALASALEKTVEELFLREPAAGLRVRPAAPLAHAGPGSRRVVLASIGGSWVAHALPADALATSADGLLPPRSTRALPLRPLESLRTTVVVAGCDPALALLAAHLAERRAGVRLVWLQATSTAALGALARGDAHLAGAHLFDEESREFNVPFVRALLPGREALVVNLARWREGLAVAKCNPRGIRGVKDLGRRNVRVATREPGAGARRLLDRLLGTHRVGAIRGTVLGSHAAVAQAVALGAVDAGVTTESAALAAGLRFLPLAEERSDLVLPLEFSREPRGARLLETLCSAAFRRDLGAIAAYEARQCGVVLAEVHA